MSECLLSTAINYCCLFRRSNKTQNVVFLILKKVVNETSSHNSPEDIDYTTTCAKDFKRFVTLA